jgi:hypothetical protein
MIPKSGYRFPEKIVRQQKKCEAVMTLTRQLLAVLVLAAWAATFAQADARPRSAKNPGNAAGHVGQRHPAPKPLRNVAPVAPTRNAIGVATQPASVGLGARTPVTGGTPATGAVKPNAVNTHIGTGVGSPSLPAGAGRIGTTTNPVNAVRAVPSAPLAHAGGINGTGMTRRSNTLGTIGGPAKVATGITGTGMKQKR